MDYKKKYEEALDNFKKIKAANKDNKELVDFIEYNYPELKESEDERIRKSIYELVRQSSEILEKKNQESMLAWLEKQGDNFEEERVFRPLPGCDIYSAAESAVERQKSGKRIILAFNGAYIPVDRKTADEIINEYYSWVEKQCEQKPQGKPALEAWKDMRLEVYQQASGNRHEPNYSDDNTKMFSLTDIDEIFEKVAEKQGEQNPVDRIEPKFKVGDWVVNNNGEPRVFRVEKQDWPDSIISSSLGNQFINTFTLDKQYHLWTIQDAKDGDVLVASDDSIFLFKGMVDCACKHYIALKTDGTIEFNKGLEHFWETSRVVHPATKEQHDLLFQKMKEAGYEWDAEKKELRKIEQKPADEVGNYDHKKVLQTIINEQNPAEDEDREYACQSSEHYTRRELMIYNLGIANGKKMIEYAINETKQNLIAWSEEDERMFTLCASSVKTRYNDGLLTCNEYEQVSLWLKSLKERMKGE